MGARSFELHLGWAGRTLGNPQAAGLPSPKSNGPLVALRFRC